MQIVIDLPNSLYANLQKIKNGSIASGRILKIVKDGTVLPKGHGRLIDGDALRKKWIFGNVERSTIDDAPTVIEADKEVKNE